jgi:hypothetical protein
MSTPTTPPARNAISERSAEKYCIVASAGFTPDPPTGSGARREAARPAVDHDDGHPGRHRRRQPSRRVQPKAPARTPPEAGACSFRRRPSLRHWLAAATAAAGTKGRRWQQRLAAGGARRRRAAAPTSR